MAGDSQIAFANTATTLKKININQSKQINKYILGRNIRI